MRSDYLMYKYFIMLTCITYEGDCQGHDCVHEDSKLQLIKYLLEKYFHFLFLLNLFISVGCQPLKNFIFIKKWFWIKFFTQIIFSAFNNNLCRCWEIFSWSKPGRVVCWRRISWRSGGRWPWQRWCPRRPSRRQSSPAQTPPRHTQYSCPRLRKDIIK